MSVCARGDTGYLPSCFTHSTSMWVAVVFGGEEEEQIRFNAQRVAGPLRTIPGLGTWQVQKGDIISMSSDDKFNCSINALMPSRVSTYSFIWEHSHLMGEGSWFKQAFLGHPTCAQTLGTKIRKRTWLLNEETLRLATAFL